MQHLFIVIRVQFHLVNQLVLAPAAPQRVTRHTSHVTRHTSHVTRHTSHVTRHTSQVTRHKSIPPCHSHALVYSPIRVDLNAGAVALAVDPVPAVPAQESRVTRQESRVKSHASRVKSHASRVTNHAAAAAVTEGVRARTRWPY